MAAKINLFFNNSKLIQEQILRFVKLKSNNFSKEVMIFKKIFDNYFKTKKKFGILSDKKKSNNNRD